MEIILLVGAVVWLAVAIMLILIKFLAVEAWAAVRGQTSPRLLRQQERARQRRDEGVSTVGQALSARLIYRIENPPERQWLQGLRDFCAELAVDVVAEARARHQHNMWERARRRAQQRARGWQARTGRRTSHRTPPATHEDPDIVDAEIVDDEREGRPLVESACPSDVIDTFADNAVSFAGLRHEGDAMVVDFLHHEWRVRLVGEVGGWSYTAWDADNLDETHVQERVDGTGAAGLRAVVGRAATHLPPDPTEPDTEPIPPVPHDPTSTDHDTDRRETPMGTITHTIAADVRNPCFALQFSTDCRDFAYAVTGQMDILGNRQRQLKLGSDRIAAANVLTDEIRGYVDETGQSIEAYAKQVRIKDEIEADPDLVRTIDDTYLGGGTGNNRGVTPPKDVGLPPELNAADCRTPEDCERFMVDLARCFTKLKLNADEVINAHTDDGVSGKPIEFLEAQRDRTQRIATKAGIEAAHYEQHAAKRNDTIGRDPSLHGTQQGKYLSQTGA